MANLFDSSNYAEVEPTLEEFGTPIVAGDFTAWKRSDLNSEYVNSSYTLSYKARLENSGSTVITITASASGSDYLVEVGQSTTASYTVGIYHWDAFITRNSDSERVRIKYGRWEIVPNLSTSSADPRTHNKKVLDAIEAVIENRATQDQMSYSIAGRSLSRMDPQSLFEFQAIYKSKVLQEERQLRIKHGLGNRGIILTRLPT